MLKKICPKLPMRNKEITKAYYLNALGFEVIGRDDYENYLMVQKDEIEIHFFKFVEIDPQENYGQVYIRVSGIDAFYKSLLDKKTKIHPNGKLSVRPWGQKEFSVLDPDSNLLTFGDNP